MALLKLFYKPVLKSDLLDEIQLGLAPEYILLLVEGICPEYIVSLEVILERKHQLLKDRDLFTVYLCRSRCKYTTLFLYRKRYIK